MALAYIDQPRTTTLGLGQPLFALLASYSQQVDRLYFERYCGEGSYDANYLHYNGIEHSIEICDHFGLPIESVLVLGAATGRVLKHFEESWGVRAYGCEISRWAHARIPAQYRRRIACADMRRYVRELVRKGKTFDLVFSNSLIYLEAGEIADFVAVCSRLGGHFHFYSSTSESFERRFCTPKPKQSTKRPGLVGFRRVVHSDHAALLRRCAGDCMPRLRWGRSSL